MKWYITCQKCGRNFQVSDGFEGMHVQCRKCGASTKIPNRARANGIAKIGFWVVLILIAALSGQFVASIIIAAVAAFALWFYVDKDRPRWWH